MFRFESLHQWDARCFKPHPHPPLCIFLQGRKGAGSYSKSATKVGNSSGSLSKLTDSAGAPGPSMTDLVPTSQLIGRGLHCLTFTATFATAGTYYVAMCFPYSYTDIQDHLSRVTLAFRSGLGVGRSASCSVFAAALRHIGS